MTICAFTPICEADAHWIPQYVAEIERLRIPFFIYLDRCSETTVAKLLNRPLCAGFVRQDNPQLEYTEKHKQAVLDLATQAGYEWGIHWDADETWERDFPDKVQQVLGNGAHVLTCRWVNIWEDRRHIRTDGKFGGWMKTNAREKFYRLDKVRWTFNSGIVYGASPDREIVQESVDIACLHWGYMNRGLRLQHKARWDHNYTQAVGHQPYGNWDYICDESVIPEVAENPYL